MNQLNDILYFVYKRTTKQSIYLYVSQEYTD